MSARDSRVLNASDIPPSLLVERLGKIKRKADFQSTAHAKLKEHFELLNAIFSTFSLVAGVVLVALVLVTAAYAHQALGISPGAYDALVASLAIGNLTIIVLLLAWRWDVKAASHNRAVDHYAQISSNISTLLIEPAPLSITGVVELEAKYLEVAGIPRIPESKFLELKQWHLRKVAISQELDRNPHQSIRVIEERLRRRDANLVNKDPPDLTKRI
jgi:hypothetical protein